MRNRITVLAVAMSALSVGSVAATPANAAVAKDPPITIKSSYYDSVYHCVLAKNSIERSGARVSPAGDDCYKAADYAWYFLYTEH